MYILMCMAIFIFLNKIVGIEDYKSTFLFSLIVTMLYYLFTT